MNTKLDSLATEIKNHAAGDVELHKAVDLRLDKVEDAQKKVKYMAAGAGAVITAAGWLVEMMIGLPGKR